jgi:hypothetical protein
MRRLVWLVALAAAALAAGCAGTHYPIGRAAAGPNDPVLKLQAPLLPETLGCPG